MTYRKLVEYDFLSYLAALSSSIYTFYTELKILQRLNHDKKD
ncbi:MAG: hypothetical protein ACFNKL_06865 [Treponema sp.]